VTFHLGDEGGALQAEARCGSTGAADTAARIAKGLFDMLAGKRRHGDADAFGASGDESGFRVGWNGCGRGAEFGRRDTENAAR